ncbi:MAG: hypothetical protein EPN93_17565 [Spirochaetes bacterium]|nr:MAG: hypothetical protein EPN93_17565 [Spirochaetota bacterium]
MKSLLVLVIMSACVMCSSASRVIQRTLQEDATGVFTEREAHDALPSGKSLLSLKASFKTHAPGYYFLESDTSPHGKPVYRILVSIDGQSVVWKIEGKPESTPTRDGEGNLISEPEAGEGFRYILEKSVILAPGRHRIFFSLPDEDYYQEFTINVSPGGVNIVELKPIYKFTPRSHRRSFAGDVNHFQVFFNTPEVIE